MSERGFEHSRHVSVETGLDASRAILLTKEGTELFVIECFEQMDSTALKELLGLLNARLFELGDESSPTEEIEVRDLITYAETAQWAMEADMDAIERYANGYSDTQK